MRKQEKKTGRIINVIKQHILNNLKQYTIVYIFFLIGIVVGVVFVNNGNTEVNNQIGSHITTFIDCLKTDYQIDTMSLLKNIIGNHIILVFLLWFMGCTIIGLPIVYAILVYRGFSLGYTISSIILILGTGKGILFCIITLFMQNLLIIPSILALAVSGIKLYQTMVKNKKKENIKIGIIRHTVFSVFVFVILIISAFIEVYGSNSVISLCINYF